jgi:hypothetical protein
MPILGTVASFGLGPDAPTIGTATEGDASATVTYTAPTWAGKTSGSVTYTATSSPGGFTGTGSSPITVSGLTNGTAYTFTVTATTSYGVTGPASAASNSITPEVAATYQSIASSRLVSNQASLTFSSIPQTFKHLQLRWYGGTQGGDYVYFTTNLGNGGQSSRISNYGNQYYNTYYNADATWGNDLHFGGIDASNYPGAGTIDFLDYSSTTKGKNAFSRTVRPFNADAQYSVNNMMGFRLGTSTTTALTSITMQCSPSYPFKTGSTFSLYGIKG